MTTSQELVSQLEELLLIWIDRTYTQLKEYHADRDGESPVISFKSGEYHGRADAFRDVYNAIQAMKQ